MHKNDNYQQKCRVERDCDGGGGVGGGGLLQLCLSATVQGIHYKNRIQSTYIKCEHCQDQQV